MTHLLIGGDGFVGRGLCAELQKRNIEFVATTRHPERDHYLDLRNYSNPPEGSFSHVYLVAAIPRFCDCEGSPLSWIVNVDAPIALARYYRTAGFITFISSDAVEWAGVTAYGRQKAQVEAYMQSIDAAIVRPNKILPAHLGKFCELVVTVALEERAGVTRWWYEAYK